MKKSKLTSPTSKLPSNVPSLSRFQKFEAVTIDRSQIKNATYNPRTISDDSRKRLKSGIKSSGLVETLVWNARTGNLVGGHQRLSVLDDLERKQTYLLTVAKIDVDEKAEKKINLLLNNPNTQGDWDESALAAMVKDLQGDIGGTGFTESDLTALCDSDEIAKLFAPEKDAMKTTAEELEAMKERRKDAKEKNQTLDDTEFYTVLVFPDRAALDGFLTKCGLPLTERYHDGRMVEAKLRNSQG